VSAIIDVDQHLFERPEMWRDYADPARRHLALSIEPDDLGYWWVISPATGRRLAHAWVSVPEDGFASIQAAHVGSRQGIPSQQDYARDLPADYWEPGARVAKLDEFGVDQALMISNWALQWGRLVADRLDVLRANMEAWNRWTVEVQESGGGRLHGVGHVTLRGGSTAWLEDQLRLLSEGGVRTAMLSYGPADGRALSHPDHDRAWEAFLDHGIVPLFHIVDNDQRASLLPDCLFERDHDPFISAVEIPFTYMGIQVALADLVVNGVLERHPDLLFMVVELEAQWLPKLMIELDHAYDLTARITGGHSYELSLRPSEYLVRQVRATPSFQRDDVGRLLRRCGDIFMFGGDYPHCEGLRSPLVEYRERVGEFTVEATERLYGGTAAKALGL